MRNSTYAKKGSRHPGPMYPVSCLAFLFPLCSPMPSIAKLLQLNHVYRERFQSRGTSPTPWITPGSTKLKAVPELIHYIPQDVWLVNREKKVPHTAIFHRKGEHAIVEMMIPCEKVNHSLAIAVLEANLLLLRLWVSLIRSPVSCWDLLQHQDILVMFFKSDCIRLNVLQIQIIPHTDAAIFLRQWKKFQMLQKLIWHLWC